MFAKTNPDVKYLPVQDLLACLVDLPINTLICTNRVGNLSILDTDEKYVGFIDFVDGEVYFDEQPNDIGILP